MNVFECIKDKVIWRSRKFKKGERFEMDGVPTDGKGKSLLDERRPAFRIVSGRVPEKVESVPEPVSSDIQELSDKDPRTRKEIRDDIKADFGDTADHRMSKVNLIALEQKLKMLHGKDGAIGTNDEMTLLQAQELVK